MQNRRRRLRKPRKRGKCYDGLLADSFFVRATESSMERARTPKMTARLTGVETLMWGILRFSPSSAKRAFPSNPCIVPSVVFNFCVAFLQIRRPVSGRDAQRADA